MVPLAEAADSKDSPNAALTAYRGSAPGALRQNCNLCGSGRFLWESYYQNSSNLVEDGALYSDFTLFRGLKDKKGPRKRVPGTILNFSMWCQLFFRLNY